MLVWLVKHGETLPVQKGVSKMRTWNLSESLIKHGHSIVWWSSTFSHQRKELLFKKDTDILVKKNFSLQLLHAGSYKKNISFKRMIHHSLLAYKFRKASKNFNKPDVIVCSYPLIDLAKEVVSYAKLNNIPLIMDIRDQWPSTFYHYVPFWMRPLIKLYIFYVNIKTRRILNNSSRLTSMSKGCLAWAHNYKKNNKSFDRVFYIGYNNKIGPKNNIISNKIKNLKLVTQDKIVFVYAGSFGSFYNLSSIIDVAKRLNSKKVKNIHFILAGDGEQFEKLKMKSKFLNNVTLTGWLDKNDLQNILTMSNVGLLPYHNYGDGILPNKPAEYFYYGLPVISSINGELASLIQKENIGFHYEESSTQTLYEIIKNISENKSLLNEMSYNALRVYKKHFNADLIYKEFVVYIEDLNKNGI